MTAYCLFSNLCDQEIMCKKTLQALILSSKLTADVEVTQFNLSALELSGSINKS